MATYYVRKTGSDANAGTTAGTAWLTIQKALDTVISSDTIYVGAGTYIENGLAPSNSTGTKSFIGDYTGSNTGDAGRVIIQGQSHMTNLYNNYRWFNFEFITTSGGYIWWFRNQQAAGSYSQNWQFHNCVFFVRAVGTGTGWGIAIDGANFGTPDDRINGANLKVKDCSFFLTTSVGYNAGSAYGIGAGGPTNASFRLGNNIEITGNTFYGHGEARAINLATSTAVNSSGHVIERNVIFGVKEGITMGSWADSYRVANNFIIGAYIGIDIIRNSPSLEVINNTVIGSGGIGFNLDYQQVVLNNTVSKARFGIAVSISAPSSDFDYNNVAPDVEIPYLNGNTGSNDISVQPYFKLDSFIGDRLEPLKGLLGVVDTHSEIIDAGTATSAPSNDVFSEDRPKGEGIDIGAVEYLPKPIRDESIFKNDAPSMRFDGAGYFDFQVPVNASAGVNVKTNARFTGASGTKPQLKVLASVPLGISEQIVGMTAAANAWEEIGVLATADHDGVITVRVQSFESGASDKAWFDDFTIE